MLPLALALVTSPAGASEPGDQTLLYYNARMALREGQPLEAVKLWLLRNAVEDRAEVVSPHDPDFRSVTWAAMGDLGVCQDGFPTDDDGGAGLWPLALHDWVVRNLGRRKVKRPTPWAAFDVGRQQRYVAISDVLGADELRAVQVSRGRCVRPRLMLVEMGESVTADLSEPAVAARLMVRLLHLAKTTLVGERVRGTAAIEARLFDLHLQLAALAAREAQRDSREQARKGRAVGLSRESVAAMREDAPISTLDPESEPGRVLQACVEWPASEWMALSPDRRLFLFDAATTYGGDPAAMRAIALGVLDRLIDGGEGAQARAWVARVASAEEALPAREVVWGGDRGQRLLSLDPTSGFDERSAIALPRGVRQLEEGDLQGALRSFAYALQQAPESERAEEVERLSRRWLSYTASQFEIGEELLVTLQELVPTRDYSVILEDLMWRAALHADGASYERGLRGQVGRGALDRRLELLRPLASGDLGRFTTRVRVGLEESPSETLRFLDQLVERLELEDAEVRTAHVPTLARIRELVQPLASQAEGAGARQGRTATALMERTLALLQGLGGWDPMVEDARDRARGLAPTEEVFAGNVRLAPADPLPWPFPRSSVAPPPVFVPLDLTPIEWRDRSGELVFGWSIGG